MIGMFNGKIWEISNKNYFNDHWRCKKLIKWCIIHVRNQLIVKYENSATKVTSMITEDIKSINGIKMNLHAIGCNTECGDDGYKARMFSISTLEWNSKYEQNRKEHRLRTLVYHCLDMRPRRTNFQALIDANRKYVFLSWTGMCRRLSTERFDSELVQTVALTCDHVARTRF